MCDIEEAFRSIQNNNTSNLVEDYTPFIPYAMAEFEDCTYRYNETTKEFVFVMK